MIFGVVVCAIAGALAAGPKRVDMFGVVVIAVVTAVGGGTVRDAILGTKAFWVAEPVYVIAALIAALATFILARFVKIPWGALLIFDAFGLALFTIVGCQKALEVGTSYTVIVTMGVITGVVGGVIRDLLCAEIPLVFYGGELYATASLAGSLAFVGLYAFSVPEATAAIAGVLTTLVVRLAAIQWHITLPVFVVKDSARKS